ncbi:hypothetical protein CJ030_MR6G007217 [Morella rubra]|uniref:Uncharacterized protein n=1 Tax=Morella rubra TaxID=262757 RepID=A0A6A1V9V8_9ROSI|nr:hypothetical protein CJ030_MR6G007217 [Morella rubra]
MSQKDSEEDEDLPEAYNKLLRKSLKLKKLNKGTLKLNEVEQEKESLKAKLDEYTKVADDLITKNLALETEVKDLRYELEKSKTQLQKFSSRTKNLDNTESNIPSSFKTVFVSTSSTGINDKAKVPKNSSDKVKRSGAQVRGNSGHKVKRLETQGCSVPPENSGGTGTGTAPAPAPAPARYPALPVPVPV